MFESAPDISYLLRMAENLVDDYNSKIPAFFRTKFPHCYAHLSKTKFKVSEPKFLTEKLTDLDQFDIWRLEVWPGDTEATIIKLDDDNFVICGSRLINGETILEWTVSNKSNTIAAFYAICMRAFFDHEMYL